MKKINKKYLAAAILAGGAAVFPLTGSASAIDDKIINVPVNLTAGASSIDVTTPDLTSNAILMTFEAGKTEAKSVTDLKIKNNSTAVPVYVKNIIVDTATGKVVTDKENMAYGTDFAAQSIDSGKWGIAITKRNNVALSSVADLKTGYSGTASTDPIATNSTITYTLSGKSAAYSTSQTAINVGSLKITIAAK